MSSPPHQFVVAMKRVDTINWRNATSSQSHVVGEPKCSSHARTRTMRAILSMLCP